MNSIYQYFDYRKYLHDYYEYKKKTNKRYSYRVFNKLAGLKSPSFLKEVCNGKLNLSIKNMKAITQVLNLNPDEKIYFEALVSFEQETNHNEKVKKYKFLSAFSKYKSDTHESIQNPQDILLEWYHLVIFDLVELPSFRQDPRWIQNKLLYPLTLDAIEKSLKYLVDAGFLEVNPKTKRLQKTKQYIGFTSDNVKVALIKNFHILEHEKVIQRLSDPKRTFEDSEQDEFQLLGLNLSEDEFFSLREKVRAFMRDVTVQFDYSDKIKDRYCRLNIAVIPYTKISKKKKRVK